MNMSKGFRMSACLVLLLTCQGLAQDDQADSQEKNKKEFNVDFFVGWGNCYRPGDWTPLLVGVTHTPKKGQLKSALSLTIQISAMQDGMNKLIIERPIVLLPYQHQDQHFCIRLAQQQEGISLKLIDQSGNERWQNDPIQYSASLGTLAAEVKPDDLLVVASGGRVKDLMSLGRNKQHIFGRMDNSREFFIRQKEPRLLPFDRMAYNNLDLLILHDIDMAALRPGQVDAICQHVRSGGTLLMVLGTKAIPADHALAKLLPVKIGAANGCKFFGHTLVALNLDEAARRSASLPPQMVWPLEGPLPPGWAEEKFPRSDSEEDSLAGQRMSISGPCGFGKICVLAFDPVGLENNAGTNDPVGGGTEAFWGKLIVSTISDEKMHRNARNVREYSWGFQRFDDSNEAILNYLVDIPQMKPLSIWWVIGLLALLGLLLGPIDYFVLKKLKVQPLTWLTSAVVIVLFTVGAYYGVRYIRGNLMRIRAVSVIDAPAAQTEGFSDIYAGIFAPDTDSYELTGLDGKPLAQAGDMKYSWWSGKSSFHDARGRLGTRNIYCRQIDGANIPSAVPISIWTMQHLLCESLAAKMPFSADLDSGGNLIIHNKSETPIRRFWVWAGNTRFISYDESILPGNRKNLTLSLSEGKNDGTFESGMRLIGVAGIFSSSVVAERTRVMSSMVDAGATVVIVEFADAPLPFAVKGYASETSYVAYARQVVFPRSAGRAGMDGNNTAGASLTQADKNKNEVMP